MKTLRISPTLGVSLVALVLATSGAAYAAISSSSNHIVACVHHKGGGLYIAPKCAHHDKRLKWNVTGPQGVAGSRGATGGTGAAGATGPSNAFEVNRAVGPTNIGTTPVTVATLANLPAGAYEIQAKTEVTSPSSGVTSDVACSLNAGSDKDSGDAFVGDGADATFIAVIPLMLTHTFTGTGTVTVTCSKDLAAVVNVANTTIVATKVGSESHAAVTG